MVRLRHYSVCEGGSNFRQSAVREAAQASHPGDQHVVLVGGVVEDVERELDALKHVQGNQGADSGQRRVVVIELSVCATKHDTVLGFALEFVAGCDAVEASAVEKSTGEGVFSVY